MKAFPDTSNMRAVSADEWAEHLTNFRTYQTESVFNGGYSIMYSRLVTEKPGYVVAEVHYMPNNMRAYFIRN